MKKVFSVLLALCLLAAVPALAEQDLTGRPVADGVVAAVKFVDVTAPYSGTLTSFDLSNGDVVAKDAVLAGYVTTDLFATEDGTVKAIFAGEGQDATAAMARYGAVLAIEPSVVYQVDASTDGAYNDEDNKLLHLGETLYFKTSGTTGAEGSGRVVSVTDGNYRVDVLTGDFDKDDSVTMYRRDNYATTSNVGKGTIVRRNTLLLSGAGRVATAWVKEGDAVKEGQKLLSFVAADAAPDAYASEIKSPESGVVEKVLVNPGQQVWKGQVIARIDLTDPLEVQADVDEVDLGTLKVGDLVPVTLDMDKQNVLIATVTQISALGVSKQNAAYFTVHATLPSGSAMLGASASMYLPVK